MILERVLALYETEPDLLKRRKPPSGNPTASAVGGCLAAMQMCRFPALTHPEMRPIRSAWVFEDGDLHAEAVKAKIVRAFPGITGLSEECFYFPVPVTSEQEMALQAKITARDMWGSIRHGFVPPKVERGPDGGLGKVRLIPQADRYRLGFIVDPGSGILWCPLYVDHVMNHPEHGLVVMEFKSMSRFAFRKALLGEMGDRERMQLAMIGAATGLDTCWILKGKDTAHLLEIVFLRGQEKTRVTLTKTNGQQETFLVPRPGLAVDLEGRPVDLQENETWDVGEVWTPWDPALLEQARQRVLDVLLFEPSADAEVRDKSWMREFGPDYQCPTCDGTGTQTNRKGGNEPLKKPKPCETCGQTGLLDSAVLPFNCSYCSVVKTCWASAKVRLEIGTKPEYIIDRADYEASGLTFTPRGQ